MEKSEVAQLRAQIDAEYEAGRRALYAPAQGVSRHQFITARMQRTGAYASQLIEHKGAQAAMPLIVEMMDKEAEIWKSVP